MQNDPLGTELVAHQTGLSAKAGSPVFLSGSLYLTRPLCISADELLKLSGQADIFSLK